MALLKYTLQNTHNTVHSTNYTLIIAYYIRHTTFYTPHTTYCTLHAKNCTLTLDWHEEEKTREQRAQNMKSEKAIFRKERSN